MTNTLTDKQVHEAQAALVAGFRPVDVVTAVVEATGLSHVDAMNAMLSAGVRGLLPSDPGCACGGFCGGKCGKKKG